MLGISPQVQDHYKQCTQLGFCSLKVTATQFYAGVQPCSGFYVRAQGAKFANAIMKSLG